MESPNEEDAVTSVAEKLSIRYPSISPEEISRIVHEEHRKFDGRPVRSYIAVLVEHAAKERLMLLTEPAEMVS